MEILFEPGDRVQATRRKKSRIRKGTIVRIENGRAFVRWQDCMGWMRLDYLKPEQEKAPAKTSGGL